jgi:TRAP-type mannitol/chloroaromatic compound transport system permease small subunit
MSDKVGIVAMALIAAMIGILLLDAVTRNLIRMPLHWCIELAQFTLTAYYFLGGAITLKNNDHVRMDLFYDRLSVKGKAWMISSPVDACFSISPPGEMRFSMWNPSMIPIGPDDACLAFMLLQTISLAIKHTATIRGTSLS